MKKIEKDTIDFIGSKKLPFSKEVEMSLLGTMLLNKSIYKEVIRILSFNDFYFEVHQIIYETIVEMFYAKESIDMITLSEFLEKKGKLEFVGGTFYISELESKGITIEGYQTYYRLIKEYSIKRLLINLLSKVVLNCYSKNTDIFVMIEELVVYLNNMLNSCKGNNVTNGNDIDNIEIAACKHLSKCNISCIRKVVHREQNWFGKWIEGDINDVNCKYKKESDIKSLFDSINISRR